VYYGKGEPPKKVVIVSVVFSVFLLSYMSYIGFTRYNALSGPVGYTAGTTVGFVVTASGRSVQYEYEVEGRRYSDIRTYAYNSIVPGGRYLVKFSVENPSISEIYQDKPIPVDIVPPKEGWKSKPKL
jgi:hypothetical protein